MYRSVFVMNSEDTKDKTENMPFGLHLTLDIYNCDPETLNDPNLVKKMLNELPEMLEMRKMMEPVVMFAQPNGKRDPGGYSGFVMIQESHISIHTFIKRRFVTADVYSCKEFDAEKAVGYFKNGFDTTDADVAIEKRGLRYPSEDIDS